MFLALLLLAVLGLPTAAGADGWVVLSSQWRPDVNKRADNHVWDCEKWHEGWNAPEQFYPKYAVPAGTAFVILRNETGRSESITLTHINGMPLSEAGTDYEQAGLVVWYRVEAPNAKVVIHQGDKDFETQENVPPGEWVVCSVRFRKNPPSTTRLRFSADSGPVEATISQTTVGPTRAESVCFSPRMDRAYIYVSSPGKPGHIRLDGAKKESEATFVEGPKGSKLTLVEIKLPRAWKFGSHHLVSLAMESGENLTYPVRAWDGYFMIGLAQKLTGKEALLAKSLGVNTCISEPSDDLKNAGLNFVGGRPDQDIPKRVTDGVGLLFYQNHDMPDNVDYNVGDALPFYERLGIYAQRKVLAKQRWYRKYDPASLDFLHIGGTFKPMQFYVYGQISDICGADNFVPLGGNQMEYVWHSYETARDAFAPKPMVTFLRTDGQGAGRPLSAEEIRIAAFYAIGCGAKGIVYEGKVTDTPLWREIGRINKDISALAPQLAIGCPAGPPSSKDSVWTRTLMCGRDRVVLVAVNTNYTIDYSLPGAPAATVPGRNVRLSVALPRNFRGAEVHEVRGGRLIPFDARVQSGELKLTLDELATARAFLISR